MPNRALDWLRQAKRDLQQAQASQADERYEWACFAAHQAAEKAVKALHLALGQEAWGHLVARLFTELPPDQAPEIPTLLLEKAKVLDNFYIPTRYPDSHPEGSPFDHYGILQSQEAIKYASEIVEFVDHEMA
ncbi:HEPN domain-containing protein [Leptolyngbya sp. BC1307]|uniref:HEPN domain-containing protein n=1 Tax=Leptolyngbya sp. BC1307 TaxID=2029589 RepID=UPI000EFCE825|nr:HEPN domain-containing protein [Leptolyngbya sp. BC1307]